MSRAEIHAMQKEKVEKALAGSGKHIFMNRTRGELLLPKPGLDGKKKLQIKEQFIGDSYFFSLCPSMLLHVENLDHQKESVVSEPKVLLTEQPPIFTTKGHVEYVQQDPNAQKLNEQPKKVAEKPKKTENKLLIEPNNDAVVMIR